MQVSFFKVMAGSMKKNIGRFDQVLRIGISVGLIYLGFFDFTRIVTDPLSGYVLGFFGVASLFVAIIRFCPLYYLTGINTCQRQPSDTK